MATAQNTRVITSDTCEFTCAEGDTVLRAALRAGVAATYECNSGGCGSCAFTPMSGSFQQVQDDPPGLTARDRRRGRLLSCQSVPVTDCEVQLRLDPASPEASGPVGPRPEVREGVVVERRELTHDITELTVMTDGPAEFLPGQYAMVGVGCSDTGDPLEQLRLQRGYSMSNVPNRAGHWQFLIKEVPGGAVSGTLARSVMVGNRLRLDGPYGHAYLRDSGRDVLCIAGGSGLAPMVSVARGLAQRGDSSRRSIAFFYGGRARRDLCAGEFVSDVGTRLRHASLVDVLSDVGPDSWVGPTGFVHEAVRAADLPDLHERDVYVAGPPVMVDAVVRLLAFELDVSVDRIFYDRFF